MWAMYHIKYRSLALMVQPEHTSMPLQKLKILKAPRPFFGDLTVNCKLQKIDYVKTKLF